MTIAPVENRYASPTDENTLPEGWAWATVEEVTDGVANFNWPTV
jgi:hypothetical protein